MRCWQRTLHKCKTVGLAVNIKLPRILVTAVLAASVNAQADGPKAPLPPELISTNADAETIHENIQQQKANAAKRQERRAERNMRQYKDPQGRIILTNRPEKYGNRKGYIEVEIKYEAIIVTPRYKTMTAANQYTSSNIEDIIKHYSKHYVLDENLVRAVIRCESNFNPYAVSRAGARGLMQLMPETAAEMGVTDIFDPAQNIAGGTQYLAKMFNLFDNNIQLALAAYNAGPNAVAKHKGIPPYAETKQYVKSVTAYAAKYAGKNVKTEYAVLAKKPSAAELPTGTSPYVIHFRSGYTQPVDKIIDEDPYYYVQFGNRTALVRKEHVEKIVENA